MIKFRQISLNRGLLNLTAFLLIITFSFQSGYGLAQQSDLYSYFMAVEFSGITQNAIEACPWILNLSTTEITGINEEFRNYFVNDVKNETAQYPHVFVPDNFTFKYSDTTNKFNHCRQASLSPEDFPYKYNTSEFNPYYCIVFLEYHYENITIKNEYNSIIAPALENLFANKWYIEQAMILSYEDHYTILDSTWFFLGLITLTIFWTRFKRKLK